MGNTATPEYPSKEQCKTYYNLVMMQVTEKDAYEASQKYPNDIDRAISYIASQKREKLKVSQTQKPNTTQNKMNRFPKSTEHTNKIKTERELKIGKLLQILYSENTCNVWLCFEQNNTTFVWYHTFLIYNPNKIGEIAFQLPLNKIDIPLSLNYEIICVSDYLFCSTDGKGYFINVNDLNYDITKYKQQKHEIVQSLSMICGLNDHEIVNHILSYIYLSENVAISMNINKNKDCDQTFNIYCQKQLYQSINFSEYTSNDFNQTALQLSKDWKEFEFKFNFNTILMKIFNGEQLFGLFNTDSIRNDKNIYYFCILDTKTQIFYVYDYENNKIVHSIDLIEYEWPPPNIRSNPQIFMLGFCIDFDAKLIFILFADRILQNVNSDYDIFGCYINPLKKMLRNELIIPSFNTESGVSCDHICKSSDKQSIHFWLSYGHRIHILTKFYEINAKTLKTEPMKQYNSLITQDLLTETGIFMTDRKIMIDIL